MTRLARAAAALSLLAVAACGSSSSGTGHRIGDETFVSSPPGGGSRGGPVGAGDGAAGSPSASPAPPTTDGKGTEAASRAVEESDLYARSGSTLLVQNMWRGLQVLDLADPAHPRLTGRLPLRGTPAGLYLRGTTAIVLARDHLAWSLVDDVAVPEVTSLLWTVDVSNPAAPKVLSETRLAGQVRDSRLVGDALYLFTGGLSWWGIGPVAAAARAPGAAGTAAEAIAPASGDYGVSSYDLSDLAAPREVDAIDFPTAAWGWDLHAHVADGRITIAAPGWDTTGAFTKLVAVDARDPSGKLALGAAVTLRGTVQDRWAMDLDAAGGTFRVVTADGWNLGATLTVLKWATPGTVAPLSHLHVDVPETLTAAAFEGTRGYLVTSVRVDPLWVIDLSDPAKPAVTGELKMPGQLDFLRPRGDRLLALGHTAEAGKAFQLHVSLLDVADPAKPALLVRRTFGPDWGWVPASADDLHKAFVVAGDLVIVPFEGWDQAAGSWAGGTQLLTLSGDALTLGGFVAHAGDIQRAFPLGAQAPGVLAAFSNAKLQTLDATDRAKPFELASLDLAREVTSIAVVGGAAAELTGEAWRGTGELVVVPAADPDAPVPAARFAVDSAWGKLFRDGTVVWTFGNDWRTGKTVLEGFDLADAAKPVRRGKLTVPAPASGGWWWVSDAVKVGRALVASQSTWTCEAVKGCESHTQLLVLGLANPDAPAVVATVELPSNAWTGALRAVGTDLWYTQYAWEGDTAVRYFVGKVGLANPARPVQGAPVNVPGEFYSASDDGSTLYTTEIEWPASGPYVATGEPRTRFHTLALTSRGTARLVGTVETAGYFWGAVRSGARAFAAGTVWSGSGASTTTSGAVVTVDLERLKVANVLATDASWPQVLAAEGGKLFVAEHWPLAAIEVYGLATGKPVFEQAVPTFGWTWQVVVEGGVAYLPSGPYGVVRIPL
ncbi:MAG: beta-propeller domain-containing protein [Anaeromyxobacter sp.]